MENELGKLIKAKRKELDLSQEALADRVGMSRAYLSQIENGVRGWPQIYIPAFAKELGVTEADLAIAAGKITPEKTDPDLRYYDIFRMPADVLNYYYRLVSGLHAANDAGEIYFEPSGISRREWDQFWEDTVQSSKRTPGDSFNDPDPVFRIALNFLIRLVTEITDQKPGFDERVEASRQHSLDLIRALTAIAEDDRAERDQVKLDQLNATFAKARQRSKKKLTEITDDGSG